MSTNRINISQPRHYSSLDCGHMTSGLAPIHYSVTLVAVRGVAASPLPVVLLFSWEKLPPPRPQHSAPPRPRHHELITAAIFHIFLFALPAGCSSWLLGAVTVTIKISRVKLSNMCGDPGPHLGLDTDWISLARLDTRAGVVTTIVSLPQKRVNHRVL